MMKGFKCMLGGVMCGLVNNPFIIKKPVNASTSLLYVFVLGLTLMLGMSFPSYAQDDDEDIVTLSTTITGNQEQPTVLYIVPWKQASDDSILYQPLGRQMKSVFGHVERPEHEREVKYLDMMSNP